MQTVDECCIFIAAKQYENEGIIVRFTRTRPHTCLLHTANAKVLFEPTDNGTLPNFTAALPSNFQAWAFARPETSEDLEFYVLAHVTLNQVFLHAIIQYVL